MKDKYSMRQGGALECLHWVWINPYWPDEDKERWSHIRTQAENLLVLMTDLEQKLSAMAPIYQSFVPISPEVTTTPVEMQLEPAKPDITSSGQ